jgi:para-aminobenzoate synthetase / 4-amino-4-deoxychorismate lyase
VALPLPGQGDFALIRDWASQSWLRFRRPREVVTTKRLEEVLSKLEAIERRVEHEGLWAAGFIAYDAAPAFDPALHVKPDGNLPLLWFGLYGPPESISLPHADEIPPPLPRWNPSITDHEYREAIGRIKESIRVGETYQVNFTFRLNARMAEDPWMLFLRLARAHTPAYGAFLTAADWVVCSFSPELYFALDGSLLTCRPMKGTADRGLDSEDDRRCGRQLQSCPKNRAENVMIVDMVRNDLGRIAQPGTVQVQELFAAERHSTVWQLTSTVTAQTDVGWVEILGALFPPASITGAPKPQTMRIIAGLESAPRDLYTGCIGFLAPGRRAQFNVAIRTATFHRPTGTAEYGVGGGVTWDSLPEAELSEALAKGRILLEAPEEFELLETMLWTPASGYWLLDLHLERMKESAEYFAFRFHRATIEKELQALAAGGPAEPRKVRLLLLRDGQATASAANVPHLAAGAPKRVALAKTPVNSRNPFLYHKTTLRKLYDEALASQPGFDDVLLWNEQQELTESCLANLVVELADGTYTPPVSCGLLPGTYRASLLRQGLVSEKRLTFRELALARRVYLVNSVRGQQEVVVENV